MFKKGKVYRTKNNQLAKVLWITSDNSHAKGSAKMMTVLVAPYTQFETIVRYDLDGKVDRQIQEKLYQLDESKNRELLIINFEGLELVPEEVNSY